MSVMVLRLFSLLCLFFIGSFSTAKETEAQKYMKALLSKTIPFRPDGKIYIPKNIKHVKLDIGLSYNAPMSQYWLTHEKDLLVFGFEPNPSSVHSILQGAIKLRESHGDPLETRFIGKNFFLIPCALGLSRSNTIKFYVTKDDPGCSSMYVPKYFEIERIINVPIFSLIDFFDLFPFDTHPVIDYIKIDAQGADLDIVKSAGKYLKERVIYITIEAEDKHYENTNNGSRSIDDYMKSLGFVTFKSPHVYDPTYFNPRFSKYIANNRVQIFQS